MATPRTNPPSPPLIWELQAEQTAAVVVRLEIFICVGLALAILFRLPRSLAMVWKSQEWRSGHILRRKKIWEQDKVERQTVPIRQASTRSRFSQQEKEDIELETLDSTQAHRPRQVNLGAEEQVDRSSINRSCPPHITTCPSALWPLVNALNKPIFSRYTNLRVLILLAYSSLLAMAFIFHSSLTDPNRASFLAVSQLPFLFAFAARNNIIAWIMGLNFQHFNYLHRFLGRFIVFAVNAHAFGHVFPLLARNIPLASFMTRNNIMGLVALLSLNTLSMFSGSYFIKNAYNVFLTTHYLFLVALPAIYFHAPSTLPFLVALTIPYSLDLIIRSFKTRYVTAIVRPLPRLDSTRIDIPLLNSGWRPGQYVHVRVLTTYLGWFRWLESHPFTISTAVVDGPQVGDNGVTLICKNTGAWTRKLFDVATKDYAIGIDRNLDVGKTVKVLVEGPYGGPGHTIYPSYSAVTLIIGGSGITYALSVVQDLVQKDLQGRSRVKVITLVWVVQKLDALTELLPLLTQLTSSSQILSISVHYTRARQPASLRHNKSETTFRRRGTDNLPANTIDPAFPEIPRGVPITLRAGRPTRQEFKNVIENTITSAVGKDIGRDENQEKEASGVLVGVCGPVGMGKDVRSAVHSIHMATKYYVGGIDVHEEVFGY